MNINRDPLSSLSPQYERLHQSSKRQGRIPEYVPPEPKEKTKIKVTQALTLFLYWENKDFKKELARNEKILNKCNRNVFRIQIRAEKLASKVEKNKISPEEALQKIQSIVEKEMKTFERATLANERTLRKGAKLARKALILSGRLIKAHKMRIPKKEDVLKRVEKATGSHAETLNALLKDSFKKIQTAQQKKAKPIKKVSRKKVSSKSS